MILTLRCVVSFFFNFRTRCNRVRHKSALTGSIVSEFDLPRQWSTFCRQAMEALLFFNDILSPSPRRWHGLDENVRERQREYIPAAIFPLLSLIFGGAGVAVAFSLWASLCREPGSSVLPTISATASCLDTYFFFVLLTPASAYAQIASSFLMLCYCRRLIFSRSLMPVSMKQEIMGAVAVVSELLGWAASVGLVILCVFPVQVSATLSGVVFNRGLSLIMHYV